MCQGFTLQIAGCSQRSQTKIRICSHYVTHFKIVDNEIKLNILGNKKMNEIKCARETMK